MRATCSACCVDRSCASAVKLAELAWACDSQLRALQALTPLLLVTANVLSTMPPAQLQKAQQAAQSSLLGALQRCLRADVAPGSTEHAQLPAASRQLCQHVHDALSAQAPAAHISAEKPSAMAAPCG